MPGIRHQRYRMGNETQTEFDYDEQNVERNADREGAVERQGAVTMAAMAVPMTMTMLMAMAVLMTMAMLVVMVVAVSVIMVVRPVHLGCLAPQRQEILGRRAVIAGKFLPQRHDCRCSP